MLDFFLIPNKKQKNLFNKNKILPKLLTAKVNIIIHYLSTEIEKIIPNN